ncbi:MAG: class I SAM-dependent methyltransferase [Candidatus Omnitrophica bacterium]|nr:class I SAM-dependent methyltransferase [Candidatus Omnitrophota bacterium]
MKRIPEPDLMDTCEQAQAYAEADFSEAHDAFVSHFRSRFPDFSKGTVLDLGCGTADVIIRFAHAFPKAQITGIDGADAMLDIGLRDVEQKGLLHQIKLHKCLLPDADLLSEKFDAVISNSLLHHLNNPLIIWNTIKMCSKKDTPLFVMDLKRPDSADTAERLVKLYAGDASPVLQKDFYNSLLAAYEADEIKEQLKAVRLEYLKVEEISDRHLIVWGTKYE